MTQAKQLFLIYTRVMVHRLTALKVTKSFNGV